ncbi:MAG TPA: SoxR reducing system RseC family protein [Spirochaetales bacterium]|nr:SoxR reducing system RseC family protein [Spirochaetales bacterium]
MRERGTIKKIEGKLITISMDLTEGCAACANGMCKSNRSALMAHNPNRVPVAEGDHVEVEIPSKEQAKSAFWALGLPLIMLFVGYGVGQLLFPQSNEGIKVLFSAVFFGVFLLVGLLVQRQRNEKSFPVIVGKVI